ncbi:MAG: UDP-glucose/GDP-mannose dehydrogenase family protein [Mucinivorans sp.]
MKITIVGTGYVGLVSGTCFAEMGSDVTCVDIDAQKIENLKNGKIPIFEPGLDELVTKNVREGRLHFSTSLAESIRGATLIFSAVGTPQMADGSADLSFVMQVARTVGQNIDQYVVFVTKSTVPIGTSQAVRQVLQGELDARGVALEFDVASNPEFLKQGAAIKDFMNPDRVVIGVDSPRAQKLLEKLYKPFMLNGYPIMFMDIASAEMTKYAANAMLATRISFMNDVAALCERVGANVDQVRHAIGADARIGSRFLYSGCGYGGSCFPKDVRAMAQIGRQMGYPMQVIEAVDRVNEQQKSIVFDKLSEAFAGDLRGKVIALWGLAFKPQTDDMREAPSLVVIDKLLAAGAEVRVFDPVAMGVTERLVGCRITYCDNKEEAARGSDAVALLTEWKQFRLPDWQDIGGIMRGRVVVDGRNIFDPEELHECGFRYSCIGKRIE